MKIKRGGRNRADDKAIFARLCTLAAAGERCPQRESISRSATRRLARAGYILIEVYPHNWRVVEILIGPHKGKRTAPCPDKGAKPHLTLGAQTVRHRGGRSFPVPTRDASEVFMRVPSAPRLLSRKEVERMA